ncbi:universal stress protein [Halobacteriaceae archaeon GCM10025711]
MTGEILVATDGSRGAVRGVEYALNEARRNEARLHVVSVVDGRRHGTAGAFTSMEIALDAHEQQARAHAEEIVDLATEHDLDAVALTLRGHPHEAILKYATDQDVDLIVLGEHGLSRRVSTNPRSTTSRVEAEADRPVYIA